MVAEGLRGVTEEVAGSRNVEHLGESAFEPGAEGMRQSGQVLHGPGNTSGTVISEIKLCELGVGLRPRMGRVACCGHRGARLLVPENTVPAFRKALEVGANCMEMDVHLTLDGHLAVVHGGHMRQNLLPPQAGAEGTGDLRRVEEMTWREVRNLSAGEWFSPALASVRVPSLTEVMVAMWCEEALLVLDLKIDPCTERPGFRCPKPGDLEKRYAAEVGRLLTAEATEIFDSVKQEPPPSQGSGPAFSLMLSSFDHKLVNLISKVLGEVTRPQAAALLPRLAGMGYILHPREKATGEGFEDRVEWLAPHFARVKDADFVRLRKHHPRVSAWVSDDPKVNRELVAQGVEAIITNDPTLCPDLCTATSK